ncbi:DNA polymerase family A-domain-containing protein [Zopfochytrium polystomum]|nr:DNA polymerase family A-domain-containing protein [Zopfochytrium polystomum]
MASAMASAAKKRTTKQSPEAPAREEPRKRSFEATATKEETPKATPTSDPHSPSPPPPPPASVNAEFRSNEVDVQMISASLHAQIFPNSDRHPTPEQVELSRQLLEQFSLRGKHEAPVDPITFKLPPLLGRNIEEHFYALGLEQAQRPKALAVQLASVTLTPRPKTWSRNAGWTRYNPNGSVESVPFPDEDALVFDIETMYNVSPNPLLAVAASATSWYSWVSPEFAPLVRRHGRSSSSAKALAAFSGLKSFIPLGARSSSRIVVGHNVCYDRARVVEEYNLSGTNNDWIDTMSLHFAVSGLSTQQRPEWLKKKKEEEEDDGTLDEKTRIKARQEKEEDGNTSWTNFGSMASLKYVVELHLKKEISKEDRKLLSSLDVEEVAHNFDTIMQYCSSDVLVTHELFCVLCEKFLEKCPHPASFAGMVHMGKGFLPTTDAWNEYIDRANDAFKENVSSIENEILELAESTLELAKDDQWKSNEWLRFLDWEPGSRRIRTPELVGKPKWYRELWSSAEKRFTTSLSKRSTPYLMSIQWNGCPLYYNRGFGWLVRVPVEKQDDFKGPRVTLPTSPGKGSKSTKGLKESSPDTTTDSDSSARIEDAKEQPNNPKIVAKSRGKDSKTLSHDGYDEAIVEEVKAGTHLYLRVPHKDGDDKNCGNPLSKSYIKSFESGVLTSPVPKAMEILKKSSMCSYWKSARDRITSQLLVPAEGPIEEFRGKNGRPGCVILPQTAVMGTITRRAVEALWMTAANAKRGSIGSELKSNIVAPEGYCIVGADVDSEELWICSLIGDSQFSIHGATPLGFMTLQGTKAKGTDLHTTTGNIVGIDRDSAKVFNYSRLYGAGQKHSVQLLLQNRPGLDKSNAESTVKKLMEQTKGMRRKMPAERKTGERKSGEAPSYWVKGSESHMFNLLEKISTVEEPRTPVLNCAIPDSLLPRHVRKDFMTSRVNWVVQSSGVDYLHLLLVSMNYLMRRLRIKGRFMISIHDELRYLVPEDQTALAAFAMQVSNLWTRCLFARRVGMDDLPQNVAFFSNVDIDHCLRKEVDMDCVTPSNPVPVEKGQKVGISEVLRTVSERFPDMSSLYGNELESVKKVVEAIDWSSPDVEKVFCMSEPIRTAKINTAALKFQMGIVPEKPKPLSTKTENVEPAKLHPPAKVADLVDEPPFPAQTATERAAAAKAARKSRSAPRKQEKVISTFIKVSKNLRGDD